MKLRKPLAFLLTLALLLGIAPIAGASGAVEGQSTMFQSVGTVTQEDTPETPSDGIIKVIDDTIDVRITNTQHKICVNPYGMTIDYPDDSGDTSGDSIVSVPLYIENNTDVPVDVTATATAIPYGDVVLDSEPTRYAYKHTPLENPDNVPKEERIYLYLQMMALEPFNSVENDEWDSLEKKEVITKPGGSDPITVEMPENGGAALKISGNTSLPTLDSYYGGAWKSGNGFDVNIVLSFLPKMVEDESYSVTFDVKDIDWDAGKKLMSPVTIELQGNAPGTPSTLTFDKDHGAPQEVKATESLTFTIKSAEEKIPGVKTNVISVVYLTHLIDGEPIEESEEYLYYWGTGDAVITFTETVNASKVSLDETLLVTVILDPVTLK